MHEHAHAKDAHRRTIAREAASTATKQGNDTTWDFALSHAEMGECCMRKGKERMVRMLDEFIELVRANPNLPVVPMVDGELVADSSFRRWMGSIGSASIERYFIGNDAVYFFDDNCRSDVQDCLNDSCVVWEDDELDDEKALKLYDGIRIVASRVPGKNDNRGFDSSPDG